MSSEIDWSGLAVLRVENGFVASVTEEDEGDLQWVFSTPLELAAFVERWAKKESPLSPAKNMAQAAQQSRAEYEKYRNLQPGEPFLRSDKTPNY